MCIVFSLVSIVCSLKITKVIQDTEVGHPRGGTRQTVREGLNEVLGEGARGPQPIILKKNGNLANPVHAGFDQFLVQPQLEFCRAKELNLSQRPKKFCTVWNSAR